jgi:chemotaxis signal transduction protein
MRPLALERLAGAPAFLLGVSFIRGAPVPVVDVAGLLGSDATVPAQRIVTLRIGERCVGLAVESVIGVHAISTASLEQLPPLLAQSGTATVSAISTLDEQLVLVLQGARIVPASVWQAIDAQALPT